MEINKFNNIPTTTTRMYYNLTYYEEFDINYAMNQYIAKAHNVYTINLSEITLKQSDTFFVKYNGVN